jgi:uncharacterized protein (TIGR03067 family)
MKVLLGLGFALSLIASGSLAAPGPKDSPKKEAVPTGSWQVIGLTTAGSVIEIQAEGITFEFNVDGRYRRLRGDRPTAEAGSYTVDTKTTPPTIELIVTREGKPFTTYRGIYKITDDTLTLALAPSREDRPTKFESPKGESILLWVCKRVKSKE